MKRVLVMAVVATFVSASMVYGATRTKDFTGGAQGWQFFGDFDSPDAPDTVDNTGDGTWDVNNGGNATSLSWADTNTAGGDAGEIGGIQSRGASHAGVADLNIGTMTAADTLHAHGIMNTTNLGYNGAWWLGWFNQDQADGSSFVNAPHNTLGNSPGTVIGAVHLEDGNWRTGGALGHTRADGSFNANFNQNYAALPQGPVEFWLDYDPAGGALGVGEVTYRVNDAGGTEIVNTTHAFNPITRPDADGDPVNAFGFFATGGNTDAVVQQAEVWLDNLEYTVVPEPSTILLLGMGLISLAGFRRRR